MNWGCLGFLLAFDVSRTLKRENRRQKNAEKDRQIYLYNKGYEDAVKFGVKNQSVLDPNYDRGFNEGMKIRLIPDEEILRRAPNADRRDFKVIRNFMLSNNCTDEQLHNFVKRKDLKRKLGYILWLYLILIIPIANYSPSLDALGHVITVFFIIHLIVVLIL